MKSLPRLSLSLAAACFAGSPLCAATVAWIPTNTAQPANDQTWFAPSAPFSSNATWSATGPTATYTQNFGVAFKTGAAGPFSMDWLRVDLSTSSVTTGSASLKFALRSTTNDIAYSAVAGTTEFAADVVDFTMPTTTSTYFSLYLPADAIPNISSYLMQSSTSYALVLTNPSGNIGMGRKTGYALNTTNDYYTVGEGFEALDTFRNNSANYTNTTNSYPTLAISFGSTTAVPEPTSFMVTSVLGLAGMMVRRRGSA
jgi:PEP-CTERM motif